MSDPGKPLHPIRAIGRLTGIALATFAGATHRSLGGSRRRILRRWAHRVTALAGVRLTVTGRPPALPAFLVANHLSYLDIPVLATQLDAVFIAKSDVRRWPLLGPVIARMDTIFVDRNRARDLLRVQTEIEHAWDRGDSIVLFAEGTSSRGDRILPLQPSLLEIAARRRWPVTPVTITYRAWRAHETVCWWGEMTFLDHLYRLLTLPVIHAHVVFGEPLPPMPDRKDLARQLHARLTAQFDPIPQPPN